jgi:gluconate 2-dehydrogenase gamma chain
VFLEGKDTATLTAIVDRIFPAGDGLPAASDLGVIDYIDRQLAGPWGSGDDLYTEGPFLVPDHPGHGWQIALTPAQAYRAGLSGLRQATIARSALPFEQLDAAAQDEVLGEMERDELEPFGQLAAGAFFAMLYANVLEGLFGDPLHGGNRDRAVWQWIGYGRG